MAPEEEKKVEGMTGDETDNLIITLQSTLYQMIDKHSYCLQAVEKAKKALEDEERSRRWHEEKIAAILKFLSIYNSDANEDWFAEVGMEHLKRHLDGAGMA